MLVLWRGPFTKRRTLTALTAAGEARRWRHVDRLTGPATRLDVLDPFCGSRSTLVAARQLCRHFVEIEPHPTTVKGDQ